VSLKNKREKVEVGVVASETSTLERGLVLVPKV
jgi:hypothetical protein